MYLIRFFDRLAKIVTDATGIFKFNISRCVLIGSVIAKLEFRFNKFGISTPLITRGVMR